MVDALQVAVTIFALFALSRAILRMRDGGLRNKEGAFWIGLWVLVILAVWMKSKLALLKVYFDIGRPVDVLVYLSIILLFYFSFRVYVKLTEVEGQLTKVVQSVALKKGKK